MGDALWAFRLQVNDIGLRISPMARTLYLWTERGASRHCKILDDVLRDIWKEEFDSVPTSGIGFAVEAGG